MLKLFKTIIKTGDATTKYPFKPLELPMVLGENLVLT